LEGVKKSTAVILSEAKDLRICSSDSAGYDELQGCFAPLSMTAFEFLQTFLRRGPKDVAATAAYIRLT
jgi:hypothetical protein